MDTCHDLPSTPMPRDENAEMMAIGALLGGAGPAVIGAVLRDVPDFQPDDLTVPLHADVWRIAAAMYRDGQPVDLLTLCAEMRRQGAPATKANVDHLTDCVVRCIAPTQVSYYCRVIREHAERRELMAVGSRLMEDAAFQGDADATPGELRQRAVARLTEGARSGGLETLGTVVRRIRARMDQPADVTPTGFPRLDRAMGGGFHAGRLYGFQARMKVGKSTLMASISFNMLMPRDPPVPHAYFAAEMSPDEIAMGMVGRYLGAPAEALRGPETWDRAREREMRSAHERARRMLDANLEAFAKKGLWFYGKPRMSLDEIREKLAQLCLRGKIRGAFVDYIQIIGGKQRNQSSAEFYDDVGQTLAELAKKYGIWICTAAQLNRDGDTRYGDGLLVSCDRAFDLRPLKDADGNDTVERWLEGIASRYTANWDVGGEGNPALRLVTESGPYFEAI